MKRRPLVWIRFVFWLCMIVINVYGGVHYENAHAWGWMLLSYGAMCVSFVAASQAWAELEKEFDK